MLDTGFCPNKPPEDGDGKVIGGGVDFKPKVLGAGGVPGFWPNSPPGGNSGAFMRLCSPEEDVSGCFAAGVEAAGGLKTGGIFGGVLESTGFGLGELAGGILNTEDAGVDASVKGAGLGTGGPGPKIDDSGGVFGLEAKDTFFSSTGSVFTATSGVGDLLIDGLGEGVVTFGLNSAGADFACGSFSVVSSSLSTPEMGALARGELLVGFVDGLLIPIPNGDGAAAFTGTGAATAGCLSGEPGGVVVSPTIGGRLFSGNSGEDSVRWIVGCAGILARPAANSASSCASASSLSSSSCSPGSSSAGISSSLKVSEMKDPVSSSSSGCSSPSSSPSSVPSLRVGETVLSSLEPVLHVSRSMIDVFRICTFVVDLLI